MAVVMMIATERQKGDRDGGLVETIVERISREPLNQPSRAEPRRAETRRDETRRDERRGETCSRGIYRVTDESASNTIDTGIPISHFSHFPTSWRSNPRPRISLLLASFLPSFLPSYARQPSFLGYPVFQDISGITRVFYHVIRPENNRGVISNNWGYRDNRIPKRIPAKALSI